MIGLLNAGAGGDPNAPTAPWGRDDSLGNDPLSAPAATCGATRSATRSAPAASASPASAKAAAVAAKASASATSARSATAPAPAPARASATATAASAARTRRRRRRCAGRDAGQRSPPAGGHPAHRSPELRSLPSLLRERSAQQPEPPGSRRGASSSSIATARSRRRQDGGSDLPDQGVVGCVVRGFGNLSFPQPEGGIVTVVYPIIFNPGD